MEINKKTMMYGGIGLAVVAGLFLLTRHSASNNSGNADYGPQSVMYVPSPSASPLASDSGSSSNSGGTTANDSYLTALLGMAQQNLSNQAADSNRLTTDSLFASLPQQLALAGIGSYHATQKTNSDGSIQLDVTTTPLAGGQTPSGTGTTPPANQPTQFYEYNVYKTKTKNGKTMVSTKSPQDVFYTSKLTSPPAGTIFKQAVSVLPPGAQLTYNG